MENWSGLRLTPRAASVLSLAAAEARRLGHNYLGTEHLLLGLLSEPDGIAGQVLVDLGAADDARAQVLRILESPSYKTEAPPE